MDISIIIPTHNRKEKLKQCLQSLFEQDYSVHNFEIIVVDDGSTDGTKEMMHALSEGHPNLRYLLQSHRGPAAARNLGIKEAKAEIIGFTDNDCILGRGWIKNMLQAHRLEQDAMAIGGLTKVDNNNIKALVSQFLSDGAINVNIHGKQEIIFFPTCNVSLKKNFLCGSGFKETFPFPAGEDSEFFWRFFKKGSKFSYHKDITIFHNCNGSFRSFLRQAYMYGRGNYLVQYMHKDHPLFAEIKTRNNFSFILGTFINFIKIPRFSYLLGKSLIKSPPDFGLSKKMQVYLYLILHKIMYLIGNIVEHLRMITRSKDISNELSQEEDSNSRRPGFIILDITHRCNLKCNICEIRKDGPAREFNTEEVRNLIVQAIQWGVKEFVLSGGEPFMREDIFEILDFVEKRKYHIGILTNGILLNGGFIKKLFPYLTSNTLSLSISLDAVTPEIHDNIRGAKGCFDKTFGGLITLSALKNKYPNINFNIISIILNENLEELLPLANLLKTVNPSSIQFQPLLANNLIMKERTGRGKYWIPAERLFMLDRVIDGLVEFKRNNYALVRNSENNLLLTKRYFRGCLTNRDINCLYADRTMLVANNGDVTTCFGRYGNVRQDYLRKIYISKEAEEARRKAYHCKKPCLLPCFTDY